MRIAILGSYSTQVFSKSLKKLNSNFIIYEADYSQINYEIINDQSQLYQFNPEVIIIHETSLSFRANYTKTNINYYNNCIELLESLIKKLESKLTNIKIIYPTLDFDNNMNFGNYYFKVSESVDYQLFCYNYELLGLAQKYKNLFLIDINNLVFQFGNARDDRLVVSSQLHFTIDFTKKIAQSVNNLINALSGNVIKCIILDLDNTLWGGIIGDDGLDSIQIGNLGIGKIYSEFQKWIKSLKERGIILCVCSKNDEDIAKEPFIKHPEMILSLNDIAIFIANWENKVDNIKNIKNILNISFSSIVFIDDNPVERDMVKKAINNIIVPDLPKYPALYKRFLISENLFETISYSSMDTERTKKYQAEHNRKKLKAKTFDIKSYLKSLNMQATIEKDLNKFIPRISQLTQRTNQFNARSIRYNDNVIKKIIRDKNKFIFAYSLNDKFGSYGIVSCVILDKININEVFIDTFIISCRVFNRTFENYIINHLKVFLIKNKFKVIHAEIIPTKKNKIISDFYFSIGFRKYLNMSCKLDIKDININKNYIKNKAEKLND